jgi:formate/nitrite transporter FocA (FNT family)
VLAETHNQLLAGVAFSIGFLALVLGRSELFTEGFLVPVTTVVAKRASMSQLFKLWSGTLIANLVGGWVIMWLIIAALPELHDQTVESASHFVTAPMSLERVFGYTVVGNVVGGLVLVTLLRLIRT